MLFLYVLFTCFQLYIVLKMQYMFNYNLQLAKFSWEEFCQDTSLEKAGWYVKPIADIMSDSLDKRMDFKNGNCLKSFGLNNQLVSSPKLLELQPRFKSQLLTTRYSLFYLDLKLIFLNCIGILVFNTIHLLTFIVLKLS